MAQTEEYECLCLKSTLWGESDRIVTLYAAGVGKMSAKIRGCRKAGAKLAAAASPMCFGKYIFTVAAGKYTVTGCDIYETFFDAGRDIEKFYAASAIVEFLDKTQPEYDYNSSLMTLSLSALKSLIYSDKDSSDVLSQYLTNALTLIGYAPDGDSLRRLGNWLYLKTDVVLSSLKGYLAVTEKQ